MQDVGVVPRSSLARKVAMPEGSTDGYKLVEPGDFVISLRSFEGGLEYSRYAGLVSPAYTVLKAKRKIDDDFYRHYFKSREFIGRLSVAVIGIRDGKQISYEDFSFLRIPTPTIDEQKRISKALNLAEAIIARHKSELEKLRNEKAGLMQQLLTGKRRVKVANA
jgi:type I restriction enzyme S subunit